MPSASYSSATRKLTILGEPGNDVLTISRDAAGTILINGGTIPIAGGPATVANTDLIEISGFALDDNLTLDETNGPLPPIDGFGGTGNDFILGGAGADSLNGEAGIDSLLGGGGADDLLGGSENDVLVGGPGADILNGEGGDDLIVWNNGDGTDVIDGGDHFVGDQVEVNGGVGGEVFTVTANGSDVRLDRVSPAPFSLDIGTTEQLEVNGGDGDDQMSATGNLAALIALTLSGGAGNDIILGSNGNDTLLGGDDEDFIDGQQGADEVFLGAGDDVFQWDPGDANDTVEGQEGTDELILNGNAGAEIFAVSPNGGRAFVTRNLGAITLDTDELEHVVINAGGLNDSVTVNDLTGTDVNLVVVNLSGTIGGTSADGQFDSVSVNGTGGDDAILFSSVGQTFAITGLAATVAVNHTDSTDGLVLDAGAGDDTIDASGLGTGIVGASFLGGAGNDTIRGSLGADTLQGGPDNDVIDGNAGGDSAFLGAGDDTFVWDPGDGSDVVDGGADSDTLRFNTSASQETITINADGVGADVLRNVGNVEVDTTGVETIVITASGGNDHVIVNDLTGTGVTHVIIGAPATAPSPAAPASGADAPGDKGAQVAQSDVGDEAGAGAAAEPDEAGADIFTFAAALGGEIVRLADFTSGSDSIHLSDAVFAGLAEGGLPAGAFVIGASARRDDHRIVYDQATGALYYDADGEGSGAAVQFAQLDAGTVLAASDFVVI